MNVYYIELNYHHHRRHRHC